MEHLNLQQFTIGRSSQKPFKNKLEFFFKGYWFHILVCWSLLLHSISLFNAVMEVDAALYASIARRIAVTGDWINLFADGHEWLDKPHLPFWITAVSFKIFGINDFAYKLPAFISLIAAVYFTYQLAKNIYGTATARVSTIIFITSLHLFLSCFDVRAEAYLVTFVTAAIYYMYLLYTKEGYQYLFPAAVFAAAAVCTKGIFVLITLSSGFIIAWIYKKEWRQFLSLKWWFLLLLTAVFILPELYCLYIQFDLHPEKIVFGKTAVSGIRFFFWDSQFGRFFNNGPIKGKGDIFFYLHTFLWAFLPWSLMAYAALIKFFFPLRAKLANQLVPVGTALTSFLIFSLSKFQLPHYIVILFPFFAMITGHYLQTNKKPKVMSAWLNTQLVIFMLVIALIIDLSVITKFATIVNVLALVVAIAVIFPVNRLSFNDDVEHTLLRGVCTASLVFLYLNIFFYPYLLQYQGGVKAANWINYKKPASTVILYKDDFYAYNLEWHLETMLNRAKNIPELKQLTGGNKNALIFSTLTNIRELQKTDTGIHVLQSFPNFHISQVTAGFLNAATRHTVLDSVAIAGW